MQSRTSTTVRCPDSPNSRWPLFRSGRIRESLCHLSSLSLLHAPKPVDRRGDSEHEKSFSPPFQFMEGRERGGGSLSPLFSLLLPRSIPFQVVRLLLLTPVVSFFSPFVACFPRLPPLSLDPPPPLSLLVQTFPLSKKLMGGDGIENAKRDTTPAHLSPCQQKSPLVTLFARILH